MYSISFSLSSLSLIVRHRLVGPVVKASVGPVVKSSVGPVVKSSVGPVVKASASRAEDPGFDSRLRRDFCGSSHTSDLKVSTPVTILPGVWL